LAEALTDRTPDYESEGGTAATSRDPDAFLRTLVKRFARVETAESVNRQKGLEDLRFKAGDQWPEAIRASRTLDKRPCLTINKMPTFVHQITNDQRQNRPAISVSPVGDKSDPETAKMLKGLIKQIERSSNADVAYDTGFDSAVSIGWGYWRIFTDYENDKTFNQVIKIGRIRNTFRVYLDPDSQEPDGSDAEWGFITDMIPRSEFRQSYPDADEIQWDESGLGDDYALWHSQTHIRIAEYYCYEHEVRTLVALENGHIGYKDELAPQLKLQIRANPKLIKQEREVRAKKVRWYKVTAKEILEEADWPGKWIPIVKVIGDEVDIEGKPVLKGLIRDAKDPQRMYNFWCTSETELIALAPKAPWIMEEGQVEGHEKRWQDANNKSLPYLLYKGVNIAGKPAPPPQRQQFSGPPAGVVNAKLGAAQDMQAVTGVRFDATLQERLYDESGKALRELKRVGELGNFHYIDNLARSLRFTGKILIDLIPKIYDTDRVLTILREDNSEERVRISPGLPSAFAQEQNEEGRVERLFNPKLGEYDVAVTIGPSFATKRAEAADSMLAFMGAVPQSGPIIGDLIAKNMDWPGAEEIAARLATLLPPGLQDKSLDQLPPEAKGIVASLMQQTQQLQAERDQAVQLLGDKNQDRAVDVEKINKDFAAKMADVVVRLEMKIAELDLKEHETARGNDEDVQAGVALEKITKEFEAKLIKILSDAEDRQAQREMELAIAAMSRNDNGEERQESGRMRRQGDLSEVRSGLVELENKTTAKLAKISDALEEISNTDFVFERDPVTKRIAKATRARRLQ
jgi:hypothetical protein